MNNCPRTNSAIAKCKSSADTSSFVALVLCAQELEREAAALREELAAERKALEEAYKALDDNWITHQRVVSAEQRAAKIEAAEREQCLKLIGVIEYEARTENEPVVVTYLRAAQALIRNRTIEASSAAEGKDK